MREDSTLGHVAFWIVTVLAILWALGGFAILLLGAIAEPFTLWPILIALGPIALIAAAVIVDRLRSTEDSHYSRNVHD